MLEMTGWRGQFWGLEAGSGHHLKAGPWRGWGALSTTTESFPSTTPPRQVRHVLSLGPALGYLSARRTETSSEVQPATPSTRT